MSESTIGIKIADGKYYPILPEGTTGRKRLVLTTVNDNQDSVQIDLYKGLGDSIENASYIGSLIIEDIAPAESGEPDIELILGVDDAGNLNAEASDRKSGESRSLSVSLDSVAEPDSYALPDFEISGHGEEDFFDDNFEPGADSGEGDAFDSGNEDAFDSGDDFSLDDESPDFGDSEFQDESDGGSFDDLDLSDDGDDFTRITDAPEDELSYEEKTRLTEEKYAAPPKPARERRVHPLMLAAFILAGLAIIALVVILLMRNFAGEAVPPLEGEKPAAEAPAAAAPEPVKQAEPVKPAEPVTPAAPEPVQPAPEPAKPVVEAPAPAAPEPAPAEGFWYLIKPGDTLWDLSNSFYRTPWLYGRIARENRIADPDRIYWGFRIYISRK